MLRSLFSLQRSRFSSRGMTLVECLMILVILIILTCLAIPAFQQWIAASRATTTVNQMVTALYTARTAAIERGSIVSLCASADGKVCSDDWTQGQLLFLDPDHTGTPKSLEARLRIFAKIPGNGRLSWRGFPARSTIQFLPDGFPRDQNGTFYYCPENNDSNYARAVILSKSGRVRVSTQTEDGKPLSCS
jgi:type IV fimbrial biogenesis protein FimT